MNAVIFPAGPEDADALGALHVDTWRQTYRGLLPDPFLDGMDPTRHAARFAAGLQTPEVDDLVLAAADRHGLVGYVGAAPSRFRREGEGEIQTLYVLRRAQRGGVGRRLVSAAARVLAAKGSRSLVILVLRDNIPARVFYERLGGQADSPRLQPGPGGVHHEVAYRWADIGAVIG